MQGSPYQRVMQCQQKSANRTGGGGTWAAGMRGRGHFPHATEQLCKGCSPPEGDKRSEGDSRAAADILGAGSGYLRRACIRGGYCYCCRAQILLSPLVGMLYDE